MKPTIGQRILAALIGHQLGITSDRALKRYVCVPGREIDGSWERLGEILLRENPGAGVPENPRAALGPQLVLSKPEDSPA